MNNLSSFPQNSKPNILILCSGGGAVFEEIVKSFQSAINFYLLTDRRCEALSIAKNLNVPHICVTEKKNVALSEIIYNYVISINACAILCYFGRLLTEPLINSIPCYNVHPSILPKYPGMGAEEKAYSNQDLEIGATLHKIDIGIDTGLTLFQYSMPIIGEKSLERYKRLSFICKTKVSYCFFEHGLHYGFENIQRNTTHCEISSEHIQKKFLDFLESLA